MPEEQATPLLERLKAIRERARDYFDQADSELSKQPHWYSDPWSALSPTLKDVSQAISAELAQLGPDLVEAAALSPLLSDVDQQNVGHNIKGVITALKLTLYEHWDPQVQYEEDVYRGTTPAGERAVSPLQPAVAKEVFGTFADRLQQCIELATRPQLDKPLELSAKRQRRAKRHSPESDQLEATKTLIRKMHAERISHAEICQRLYKHPRPPRAAWRELNWKQAYDHPKYHRSVKSWISKATAES